MKREKYFWGFILLAASVLLLYFAPDMLSFGFVAGMVVLVAYGLFTDVFKVFRFCESFKAARKSIDRACDVQTSTPWNVLKDEDNIFDNELLDDEFKLYAAKVCSHKGMLDEAVYSIEEHINTELIERNSNDSTVSQIPGILTSLGILGTFIGLLYGLNFITFTSISTAIVTIETMLEGVQLAFYTSIAGVIMSILFNWCYHRVWHRLQKEITFFYNDFHRNVIPSTEEQKRKIDFEFRRRMLSYMKHLAESEDSGSKDKEVNHEI